jgi:hypothetical protein
MISRLAQGWRPAAVVFLMAMAGTTQPVLAEDGRATTCQRAGLEAERNLDLPAGLLLAIGRVESGRRDPLTGRVTAWPWTINADGVGQLFGSLAEALAATRALQARGVTSVDVGCFQINLLQHPTAFASLEEAFDPQANATYAAHFLVALRTRTGSWEKAVAAYHSATSERGGPYRDRVLAGLAPTDVAPGIAEPDGKRVVIWTPTPATGRMRIWTPSPPGLAPAVISIRTSSTARSQTLPVVNISKPPN